jgi:acyl-CoA synthetase (NDP forming)
MKQAAGAATDIEQLLNPKSIAVAGASAKKESQGYEYVQTLVEAGYTGAIYPVNPKLGELLGLKCYPDLKAIPGEVDFVISAVPADATLELVDGAIEKKTKLIHFYTARFSETGREDAAELEAELKRRTREAGIRVIGPNCMGVHYPKNKISFDPLIPRKIGPVGILSQSGSHAFRIIGRGVERGVGFSKVISYGNAMDLNECDFLEHFAQDPDTEVIGAYIEGIRDGGRFLRALKAAAAVKPVVVLKGGRTSAGRSAVASHTASLASQGAVWQAAMRQAGALEVSSLNDLIDMLVAFAHGGPAAGPRVAVLGGAGGEMVESADICNEAGLDVAPVPPEVRESLKEIIPKAWDWVSNPIDGSILEWGKPQALYVLQTLATSPAYDVVLANVRMLEFMVSRDDGEARLQEALVNLRGLAKNNGKATFFVLGESESPDERRRAAVRMARNELAEAGVALYPDIERAARTLGKYVAYLAERRALG